MRKQLRFSVDPEKAKDVIEYLEGFPRQFRSEIIVTAIRFLLENMDRYISKKPVGGEKRNTDGERRNTINLDGLKAIGKQFEGGKE
jgi:hypothetical protein